ncbi:MAG: hypothetical protein M1817_005969 [Caeruleum heppii]|nr:MAG: hypothetical protein M1817_005969 [Caeruleum heppii]
MDFSHSLIVRTPFPTHRLASYALQVLEVDKELSPLVRRSFSLEPPAPHATPVEDEAAESPLDRQTDYAVLVTEYRATTNRMLRVSVNGFMESLTLVLRVMEELDVDVLAHKTERHVPQIANAKTLLE